MTRISNPYHNVKMYISKDVNLNETIWLNCVNYTLSYYAIESDYLPYLTPINEYHIYTHIGLDNIGEHILINYHD
jgi:hypothetical protein